MRGLPYRAGRSTQPDFDLGVSAPADAGRALLHGLDGHTSIELRRPQLVLHRAGHQRPLGDLRGGRLGRWWRPLKNEPAVVNGASAGRQDLAERHGELVPRSRPVERAAGGVGPRELAAHRLGQVPGKRPVGTTKVSNIKTGTDTISFDVSKVGVPVEVKASYFPNWQVSGADGPYRVSPNLMVVIPTSTHVRLNYGYTGVDYASYLLTLLGLVGLFALWRAKPVAVAPIAADVARADDDPRRAAARRSRVTRAGGSTRSTRRPDRDPATAPTRPVAPWSAVAARDRHGPPAGRGRPRGRSSPACSNPRRRPAEPAVAPGAADRPTGPTSPTRRSTRTVRRARGVSRRRVVLRALSAALLGGAVASLFRERQVAHVRVRFDLDHRVHRPPAPGDLPAVGRRPRLPGGRPHRRDRASPAQGPGRGRRTTGASRSWWSTTAPATAPPSRRVAAGADQVRRPRGQPGQGGGGALGHAGRPRPHGGLHRRRPVLLARPPARPARPRSRRAGTWWWAAGATTTPPPWCGPGACARSGAGPSTCSPGSCCSAATATPSAGSRRSGPTWPGSSSATPTSTASPSTSRSSTWSRPTSCRWPRCRCGSRTRAARRCTWSATRVVTGARPVRGAPLGAPGRYDLEPDEVGLVVPPGLTRPSRIPGRPLG